MHVLYSPIPAENGRAFHVSASVDGACPLVSSAPQQPLGHSVLSGYTNISVLITTNLKAIHV